MRYFANMRWQEGTSDADIEDRRGESGGGSGGFGGGGFGGGRLGIGGFLLLAILSFVFKQDFFSLAGGGDGPAAPRSGAAEMGKPVPDASGESRQYEFVKFVLNDAQATWTKLLPTEGDTRYTHAKLVLFRNRVQSACGDADSASGPFYCPGDEKVYLDLGFYDELKNQYGASGDFANAYVIAHEIGHHVQHLLGIDDRVERQQAAKPRQANALSVRLELQADCLAGVWGHSTSERNILERGDVEDALRAAAAIGDDRLQKMAGGSVRPESFTHGSSKQRVEWFTRGLREGRVAACDTFGRSARETGR